LQAVFRITNISQMQGKRFNALLKMHEQLDKAGFSPDKQ
jgi:hypothetical protein